jgi:SAM-dependent methyltransferase
MTIEMYKCPICLSNETKEFFYLKNSPILQNVLFDTENEARKIERVDVNFVYCSSCHFVFNPEFQESKVDYTENYNNNQMASKKYTQYIDELTDKVVRECKLSSESRILEIGCGNGYFLYQLYKKLNNKNIVGYDPAYNDQYGMSGFINKSYFKAKNEETFDVIILRHVLEGLLKFDEVLIAITSAMNRNTHLFIETPNLDYIIANQDISLMYHEVARYYSLRAIQCLLSKYEIDIQQAFLLFSGNNLGIFASKCADVSVDDDISAKLENLRKIVSQYQKVVIWGISGRAISLLTHFSWDEEQVQFGIDIDKDKQGKYIPVTGQLIISPEQAVKLEPDLIIIANANYLEEIKSEFKFKSKFLTLDGIIHEG